VGAMVRGAIGDDATSNRGRGVVAWDAVPGRRDQGISPSHASALRGALAIIANPKNVQRHIGQTAPIASGSR